MHCGRGGSSGFGRCNTSICRHVRERLPVLRASRQAPRAASWRQRAGGHGTGGGGLRAERQARTSSPPGRGCCRSRQSSRVGDARRQPPREPSLARLRRRPSGRTHHYLQRRVSADPCPLRCPRRLQDWESTQKECLPRMLPLFRQGEARQSYTPGTIADERPRDAPERARSVGIASSSVLAHRVGRGRVAFDRARHCRCTLASACGSKGFPTPAICTSQNEIASAPSAPAGFKSWYARHASRIDSCWKRQHETAYLTLNSEDRCRDE